MLGLDKYLIYLQEFFWQSSVSENPDALTFRKRNNFLWLYHGTMIKYKDSIIKHGLDPAFMGTSRGAPVEHPTGKNALSYSTNKSYAGTYTGVFGDRNFVLLCKVPNKDLFFGIRSKWGDSYLDEYQSIYIIKPKDILFPENNKYKEIENKMKYLSKGEYY
jgi:hypothetical protein